MKIADAYDRGLLKTEDPSDDLLAMLKQAKKPCNHNI